MADNTEALLRAILSTTAREAFPPDRVAEIVGPGSKQIEAYNFCDGTQGQSAIAKKLKLDNGNFSRTVGRWIEAGIVFRLGEGREAKLLHVYPMVAGVRKTGGAK